MTEVGLRELKKARTRRAIADAAARRFADRGYEQVAVSDVAREAEVSRLSGSSWNFGDGPHGLTVTR
jgi:AcrR family transcriptional regulator